MLDLFKSVARSYLALQAASSARCVRNVVREVALSPARGPHRPRRNPGAPAWGVRGPSSQSLRACPVGGSNGRRGMGASDSDRAASIIVRAGRGFSRTESPPVSERVTGALAAAAAPGEAHSRETREASPGSGPRVRETRKHRSRRLYFAFARRSRLSPETAARFRTRSLAEAARRLSRDLAANAKRWRLRLRQPPSACSSAYIGAAFRQYTAGGGDQSFAPDPGSSPSTAQSNQRCARARTRP